MQVFLEAWFIWFAKFDWFIYVHYWMQGCLDQNKVVLVVWQVHEFICIFRYMCKSNIQKSFSVKYDLLLVLPTFVLAAATLTITAGVQPGPGAGGGCDSGPGSGVRHCETQTLRGHRQWLRGLWAGLSSLPQPSWQSESPRNWKNGKLYVCKAFFYS